MIYLSITLSALYVVGLLTTMLWLLRLPGQLRPVRATVVIVFWPVVLLMGWTWAVIRMIRGQT